MTMLYLSRARLRAQRGEALAAIAPLLVGDDPRGHAARAHRVLWLLFQDVPDAVRDFLWRDEGNGRYLILSRRPPADPRGLFELETKPFAPELAPGDRLRFSLRANPVLTTKRAGTKNSANGKLRGKRTDVVMDALFKIPPGAERKSARDALAADAATRWLSGQGARAGFKLTRPPEIGSYTQVAVERRKGRPAGFAVLDLSGEIEITEPAAFLARLSNGFGAAKAFGNGLMLIRRA